MKSEHAFIGKRCLFSLLVMFLNGVFPVTGMAQPDHADTLVISSFDEQFEVGRYDFADFIYIFVDSLESRAIGEIASPSMQPHFHKDSFHLLRSFGTDLGSDIQAIWARLTIRSQCKKDHEWLININTSEVDLFIKGDFAEFEHYRSGTTLPFQERAIQGKYGMLACLPLQLPAHDTLTLYFKLRGVSYPIHNSLANNFDQTIFKPQNYIALDSRKRFFDALIIGIMLAVAIYHLIIFLFQRKKVSLFFSVFVLAYVLIIMMFEGYFHEILFPARDLRNGIVLVPIVWSLIRLFHYLFSRSFLTLGKILPTWDKIWAGLILIDIITGAILIGIVLSAGDLWNVDPNHFFSLVSWRVIINTPILLLSIGTAIAVFIKGNKAAGIYILAMLAFTLQQAINSPIAWFGIIELPQWIYGYLGHTITVLLFAMGIARQLKILQEEKAFAEKAKYLEHIEAKRLKELDEFKSRFYTNITHQFRTPLTIILGMADQIREYPSTWINKGTSMIKRNGRRLMHLVNQILNLSKLEAGRIPVRLVSGDVVKYIKYIVESFHSQALQKNLQLGFETDLPQLIIDYDPDKIMDILSNLISNSIKFNKEGNHVLVQLEVCKEAGKEEKLKILVEDDGPGISTKDLSKIFERFYQSDQSTDDQQGSGIGLAMTRELVRLLRGEITVDSIPGKGTIFNISLPITKSAKQVHDFSESDIQQEVASYIHTPEMTDLTGDKHFESERHTVLIIEDNKDIVVFIQMLLGTRFHVESAFNGREGLEKALKLIPDIIVSDVMMPEMDGIEMCQKLKTSKLTSHIPIILLTAKADLPSKIEGLQAGADAYLSKPFNKAELLVRIDKLIELRTQMQNRYRDIRFLFDTKSDLQDREMHPEDHFMKDLHRIVEEYLSDPNFSVIKICTEIGMSRAQLYKKFKALTNQSLAEFIRKIRLHKARQLLQTTSLNVTQVSLDVGFKNLSTFSRNFTEEFGLNPSEVEKDLT